MDTTLGREIRYGLVGTGMMGVEHIHNLAITPGAVVTALADPVQTSLGWAQDALGERASVVTVFDDAAALARSGQVDAVIVATPNNTHRAVLEPLFDAGLSILCEKPLATTVDDARWIVAIGFLIGGWSMSWMAHWSLQVDQYSIWMSGAVQGLGIGLVFIPLNATAFATLPPELRTDGSSLLNLTRNISSSVGISVAMTLLARNTQKVHSALAEHVTPAVSSMFDVTSIGQFAGYGDAVTAMVNAEVTRQAAMVAYIDDFYLMMWLSFLSVPLVFFMRKNTIHSRK